MPKDPKRRPDKKEANNIDPQTYKLTPKTSLKIKTILNLYNLFDMRKSESKNQLKTAMLMCALTSLTPQLAVAGNSVSTPPYFYF